MAVLLIAIAGGVYWFTQQSSPPDVSAGSGALTPSIDIHAALADAESAIEGEQFNRARDFINDVLREDPQNEQALQMRNRIYELEEQAKVAAATSTVPPTPAPQVQPTRPSGPSSSERAATLLTDASLAVGSGDLGRAESLLGQARDLDPGNPRIGTVRDQLVAKRRESNVNQRQAQRIAALLQEGAVYVDAEDYDAAIASFDAALNLDPSYGPAITARSNAVATKKQVELQRRQAAAVHRLAINIGKTEFITAKKPGATDGFEGGGALGVKRATKAPDNPGELIIDIIPNTVKPGDPYRLQVQLTNQGNRSLIVKSLQLVSTYSGKSTGQGVDLDPVVPHVAAHTTSLMWLAEGTWGEDQTHGSIDAIVTLSSKDRLKKTISW